MFWTSGDVWSQFQSQGGSLACFLTSVTLRFISGATPAECMGISMAAKPFKSTHVQMCPQALEKVFWAQTHDRPCHMHQAQCCKPLGHSGSAIKFVYTLIPFLHWSLIGWHGNFSISTIHIIPLNPSNNWSKTFFPFQNSSRFSSRTVSQHCMTQQNLRDMKPILQLKTYTFL